MKKYSLSLDEKEVEYIKNLSMLTGDRPSTVIQKIISGNMQKFPAKKFFEYVFGNKLQKVRQEADEVNRIQELLDGRKKMLKKIKELQKEHKRLEKEFKNKGKKRLK